MSTSSSTPSQDPLSLSVVQHAQKNLFVFAKAYRVQDRAGNSTGVAQMDRIIRGTMKWVIPDDDVATIQDVEGDDVDGLVLTMESGMICIVPI